MPTPREMAAVAGGHEGAGDTLGHRRRNDVPQPKHAERFRPGRPHQRRSLPWLTKRTNLTLTLTFIALGSSSAALS